MEMEILKKLDAGFIIKPAVNRWKALMPIVVKMGGDKPNEVSYQNKWWYVIE